MNERGLSAGAAPDHASLPHSRELTCRLCGETHRVVPLAPGERALCHRCGTELARGGRFGADASLVFALTALILAVPAATLPFVTVGKLGAERVTHLATGARGLWAHNMHLLSIWVLICGVFAPILLLGVLGGLLASTRFTGLWGGTGPWIRAAYALEHWAMPEVHVLAVLVAMIKLGSLVHVTIGPGFWCYAVLSLMLLLAWRSFEMETIVPKAFTARQRQEAAT